MKKTYKTIFKIASYMVVGIIFYFLIKQLTKDWREIVAYDFDIKYQYIGISIILIFLGIIAQAWVWRNILMKLEPGRRLSHVKAAKFFIYSWFGRYIPGKIWMYIARTYLGAKEGFSKKALSYSMAYEVILSTSAAFLLSIVFLTISFGTIYIEDINQGLILIPIIAVALLLIAIHPRIIARFFAPIIKKVLKIDMAKDIFLNYWQIIQNIFYYVVCDIAIGVGFFFLIKSVAEVEFANILAIIGLYIFASIVGILAIFAPSGLGVREGMLVLFLKIYYPVGIAIIISLAARLWAELAEIFLLAFALLLSLASSDKKILKDLREYVRRK